MQFINTDIQQVIVVLIGLFCLFWVGRRFFRMLRLADKPKKTCGNCPIGCCSSSINSGKKRKKMIFGQKSCCE